MDIRWIRINQRPLSQGSSPKKEAYRERIRQEAEKAFTKPFTEKVTMVAILVCQRRKGEDLDLDNLIKPIQDALKGVAYEDDSQVTPRPELFYFDERFQTSLPFLPPGDSAQKAHMNKEEAVFIGIACPKV